MEILPVKNKFNFQMCFGLVVYETEDRSKEWSFHHIPCNVADADIQAYFPLKENQEISTLDIRRCVRFKGISQFPYNDEAELQSA